jgi:glycosyltransferase involved in cell wall biosynthesis
VVDLLDKSQIKVCILTSVHIPFDVRVFHKEGKTLAKAGYNVVLIAQHNKEEIVDGIRIVPLPKHENRFKRMTKVVWKLFKLALKEKADVYHFHDPELIPVGIALKLAGKKVIYDVHEHYPNSILDKYWLVKGLRQITSKLFDLFERVFVPFLDCVIYTSSIIGNRYKKMNVCAELIANYPLSKLSESCKGNQKKYIIYLGGMTKIRGICELLEAFTIVTRKYPDWRLYLVGKATPESFSEEINKLISNSDIEEKVKLISWVPYEEKERYSSQASLGIVTYLPYANNMSCLPNKLFEYMLVGLPLVASDFPLYKEIVEESKCGICTDPTNPQKIAEAIEYLIEHPNEAKQMGENGRMAILEKYNWEREGGKLLEIYKKVLSK